MSGIACARVGTTAALFCLVLVGAPSCHEMWLEREGEILTLRYGHTGRTHGEAELKKYSPEDIVRVECFDAAGDTTACSVDLEYPVRITGTSAVTYVLTSSGYWTKTPFGTKRLPRDEAKSPLESWLSYESVKRIDEWGEGLRDPVTDDLEITALENPLDLKEGKKARLLVTLYGKPVAGVPVAYEGKPRGATDSRGRVNVRIKHGGLQLIQASHPEPADGVKADEIVRATTLVFEVEDEE